MKTEPQVLLNSISVTSFGWGMKAARISLCRSLAFRSRGDGLHASRCWHGNAKGPVNKCAGGLKGRENGSTPECQEANPNELQRASRPPVHSANAANYSNSTPLQEERWAVFIHRWKRRTLQKLALIPPLSESFGPWKYWHFRTIAGRSGEAALEGNTDESQELRKTHTYTRERSKSKQKNLVSIRGLDLRGGTCQYQLGVQMGLIMGKGKT